MNFPENDQQFSETTIGKVDHEGDEFVAVTFAGGDNGGLSLALPVVVGVSIRPGNRVRIYGKGMGYEVRGVFVNGEKLFYHTEAEAKVKRDQEVAQREKEQREQFEKARAGHDARITSLPPVLQRRLAGFQERNKDFRWRNEGYELFCCQEAVLIHEALHTDESIKKFGELPSDAQALRLPGLHYGEHSGNTFGFSVFLARLLARGDEDNIVQMHGALCPLVGCESYGCFAAVAAEVPR